MLKVIQGGGKKRKHGILTPRLAAKFLEDIRCVYADDPEQQLRSCAILGITPPPELVHPRPRERES